MKQILTETYLKECLKQARYYEYCKDYNRALKILQPLWRSIDESPDISDLSPRMAWEVLLVCGGVISYYGTYNQKKNCQELAANMLTQARETAIEIGDRFLIAETEKQIAVAYWRTSQYENAIAFSNTVLSKFTEVEQLTNKICLITQANLLMLYVRIEEYQLAFDMFERILPFVDGQDDLWLKTVFNNQAGMMFLYSDKFKQAIDFLEKTVQYARASRNDFYLGNAFNNLAYAQLNLGDLKAASEYAELSTALFSKLGHSFAYAEVLDTKAQVYLKAGDMKRSLLAADESIGIFLEGENYGQQVESMWTRTRILIALGDTPQALRQYNNLIEIIRRNLSLAVENSYIAKFDRLIYLPTGGNFDEVESNFRKRLLDNALEKCGGIITATAKFLGIKHQTLSKMVSKFPDLREKHNVKLITRSTNSFLSSARKSEQMFEPVTVMKLKTDRLKHIGLPKGTAVRFERRPVRELDLSKPIVIQDVERKYHCGFLVDAFDMYAFEDGLGNIETTFVESEIFDIGQVVGVFDETTQKFVPLEDY